MNLKTIVQKEKECNSGDHFDRRRRRREEEKKSLDTPVGNKGKKVILFFPILLASISFPLFFFDRYFSLINNHVRKCLLQYLDTPSPSIENQTRSNKNNVLGELLKTVKKAAPAAETESDKPKFDHPIPKTAKKSLPPNNGTEIEQSKFDYPLPKPEPPPAPKPINKARISEFASLLSSSVHLTQPQPIKKSPSRSEDQSFSSVPSASTDRDERESFHTVKSITSEQEQPKRHIDARFTEKIDDRGSIKINTANIKALFEQKISDTNKALSQSKEHLAHSSEVRQQQQQHRKIPVSYGSLTRTLPSYQPTLPTNPRRKSHNDSATMNKYSDHMADTKDVVIVDKSVF